MTTNLGVTKGNSEMLAIFYFFSRDDDAALSFVGKNHSSHTCLFLSIFYNENV